MNLWHLAAAIGFGALILFTIATAMRAVIAIIRSFVPWNWLRREDRSRRRYQ